MAKRSRKNSKKLDEITIINPSEADSGSDLYLMWFDVHAPLYLLVWARGFEYAFEEAVDYLDGENKPGYFTFLDESDFRRAAEDEGVKWPSGGWDDLSERDQEKVRQAAEADLTVIGHTTLHSMPKNAWGAYVASEDWGGQDVTGDDKKMVRAASLSEVTAETMEGMRGGWKRVASRKGEWHRGIEWDGPPCDATIYDQSRVYAEKGGDGRKVRAEIECEGTIIESKDLLSADDAVDFVDEVEERLIQEREDDLDADEMAKR